MRKLWSESGTGTGSNDRAWYRIALVIPVPVPVPVRNSVPVGSYCKLGINICLKIAPIK